MMSRRSVAVCLLACLPYAALSEAAAPPRLPHFELTPFIGYRGGGDFEHQTTGARAELRSDTAYSIALDVSPDGASQYEFFYSNQPTTLRTNSSVDGAGFDVEYLHIGGTLVSNQGRGQAVKPYVVGTMGITRLSLDVAGAHDETHFSLALGGGVRVPLGQRFNVRLEARSYLTWFGENSAMFCQSGPNGSGCAFRGSGSFFIQYEVLLGGAFAF